MSVRTPVAWRRLPGRPVRLLSTSTTATARVGAIDQDTGNRYALYGLLVVVGMVVVVSSL